MLQRTPAHLWREQGTQEDPFAAVRQRQRKTCGVFFSVTPFVTLWSAWALQPYPFPLPS